MTGETFGYTLPFNACFQVPIPSSARNLSWFWLPICFLPYKEKSNSVEFSLNFYMNIFLFFFKNRCLFVGVGARSVSGTGVAIAWIKRKQTQ